MASLKERKRIKAEKRLAAKQAELKLKNSQTYHAKREADIKAYEKAHTEFNQRQQAVHMSQSVAKPYRPAVVAHIKRTTGVDKIRGTSKANVSDYILNQNEMVRLMHDTVEDIKKFKNYDPKKQQDFCSFIGKKPKAKTGVNSKRAYFDPALMPRAHNDLPMTSKSRGLYVGITGEKYSQAGETRLSRSGKKSEGGKLENFRLQPPKRRRSVANFKQGTKTQSIKAVAFQVDTRPTTPADKRDSQEKIDFLHTNKPESTTGRVLKGQGKVVKRKAKPIQENSMVHPLLKACAKLTDHNDIKDAVIKYHKGNYGYEPTEKFVWDIVESIIATKGLD